MTAEARIEPETGARLVELARDAIERHVRDEEAPAPPSDEPVFDEQRGAFVTLKKDGQLRGCIGHPYPDARLLDALCDAAVGAATRDPRFPALREEELDAVTVTVNVLSPPEPIDAPSPADRPAHVEVGRDGLIVSADGRSGLLLPSVPVDQGWDETTFLAETCRKAGLAADRWRSDDLDVERFTSTVYREVEPRDRVVRDGDGGVG